jgi:predicted TIM-barrel fold metal-dependent hydrolase
VSDMLISHCHVQAKGFGLEAESNPAAGTLPELRRIMQELGVDRAVCFAPFGPQGEEEMEPNQWLLSELRDYPELVGFATVDPKREDAAQVLRDLVSRGMRGAKYHPPVMQTAIDDPAAEPFWAAAAEMHLPVHVHTGVHGWYLRRYMPLLLDDICTAHPEVRVILDHMGGIALFDQALAVLHDNKNAYVGLTQLSGRANVYALSPERRQLILETIGSDRIIYGYDYPWNHHNRTALRQDIRWVQTWGLSEEDVAKILGGNMERLLAEVAIPGDC